MNSETDAIITIHESGVIHVKTNEEYPDTAQIEKPEYSFRYLKDTIDLENAPLKLVSSSSGNISEKWKIILFMSCWSLMYNIHL